MDKGVQILNLKSSKYVEINVRTKLGLRNEVIPVQMWVSQLKDGICC